MDPSSTSGRAAGGGGGVDEVQVRRLLDQSIDLLLLLDLEARVIEVSRSWTRLLGWEREELLGTSILDLVRPDLLPTVVEELTAILGGGVVTGTDVALRTRDGDHRWVQGSASADLEAGLIYVTAADIQARKELEERLRLRSELEEVLAHVATRLVGAAPSTVTTAIEVGLGELALPMRADRAFFFRGDLRTATDPEGRPVATQPGFLVEWCKPGLEQRGDELSTLPAAARDQWAEALRTQLPIRTGPGAEVLWDDPEIDALLIAEEVRSSIVVPLPLRRRWYGFVWLVTNHVSESFSDDVVALLRLAGDLFMTALERVDSSLALEDARRELEHRNEELERSNEELERFAFAAAHDLKAPLSRIEMALTAGRQLTDPDEAALIDIAKRGAARMRRLIEDLLAYASVGTGAGKPDWVDLNVVVAEVLADLAPVIDDAGATVTADPLPPAWGHRPLLGQLVQNLVANAVKFRRTEVPAVVRISASDEVGGVVLSVRDNGIGIDPALREEVFGVFTRLNGDDQYAGSGIGLATCAKVVAFHGGTIRIDDGEEGGVSVVVTLPGPPATPTA